MTVEVIRRLPPEIRKAQILKAALTVATRSGWSTLSREAAAREAKCTPQLIYRYFGGTPKFRREVMKAAIAQLCLPVIAQGIALQDKLCAKLAPDVRKKALGSLTK